MNHFGHTAMAHWREEMPRRWAALPEPREEFFRVLGEQIAEQVEAQQAALWTPDPPGETYQEKAGRLAAVRTQAEEIALAEMVFSLQDLPQPATA